MKVWEHIDQGEIPGSKQNLDLYRRDSDFEIRIGVQLLMGTRMHGSEDALAELALERLGERRFKKVLVGGLGMGFTLSSILRNISEDSEVCVAELVPSVIEWNRCYFGDRSNHPLEDRRVVVNCGDVSKLLRESSARWDIIVLDVDNGPSGMTHEDNQTLYQMKGLNTLYTALRPSGVVGVWSANDDPRFTKRMQQAGFTVDVHRVRARGKRGGRRHTIWIGQK